MGTAISWPPSIGNFGKPGCLSFSFPHCSPWCIFAWNGRVLERQGAGTAGCWNGMLQGIDALTLDHNRPARLFTESHGRHSKSICFPVTVEGSTLGVG